MVIVLTCFHVLEKNKPSIMLHKRLANCAFIEKKEEKRFSLLLFAFVVFIIIRINFMLLK